MEKCKPFVLLGKASIEMIMEQGGEGTDLMGHWGELPSIADRHLTIQTNSALKSNMGSKLILGIYVSIPNKTTNQTLSFNTN